MRRTVLIVSAVATLIFAATACSNDSSADTGSGGTTTSAPTSGAGGGEGTVGATLKDFAISLDSSTGSAGDVTFDITNDGPSTHEFVVLNTDLAPDALPTEDGEVKEDDLKLVDEAEDIAAGTGATLSVSLDPGTYVIICNVTGHYEAGMHAGFTVS
jgi:uncharacterized cupredoxin-like copper-binding protein